MQQNQCIGIFDEFFQAQTVDVGNATILDLVFPEGQQQQSRAAKGGKECCDRIDSGRSHK